MPKKFTSVEERRVYWNNWYKNNKHRPDYIAKDRATKKRLRKERKEWWDEYRKEFVCKRCGIDDPRVLDFHHTDPSKKIMEISNMTQRGHSKERILEELAKCVCLCANCHRI